MPFIVCWVKGSICSMNFIVITIGLPWQPNKKTNEIIRCVPRVLTRQCYMPLAGYSKPSLAERKLAQAYLALT